VVSRGSDANAQTQINPRRAPGARPSPLRALAKSAWHRPEEARTAPVAGRGDFSVDTWYRRRAKGRQQAAQTHAAAVLDRLAWQVAELRAHLDRIAAANAIFARETRDAVAKTR